MLQPVQGSEAGRRVVSEAALGKGPKGEPVLLGCRCDACANEMVPPVVVCPVCGGEAMTTTVQPGEGVLYTHTTVHVGGATWKRPLRLGYVDLPNGVRIFAQLDGDAFAIGDRVAFDVSTLGRETDGTELVGYVFKRVGAAR